ncbi:MAG: lipopolysaccharide transport system permease protein [Chloroflexota bacterium]|jgi:ABC-type polysaccharide/polyol phosphate export permease|nr:lipopolysaccharide transport system permease protein [Chloroflexota bacterium]
MTAPTTKTIATARPRARRGNAVGLVRIGIGDILGHRRLTRFLVGAELKRTHANTAFGQLWWIIDPLLQMAVYFLLFEIMLRQRIEDYPLFLFVAILPWKWFSTTLNQTTLSITGRQSLIRQVQFPKLVLPTAAVLAGTVSFVFGLVALGLVYFFFLDRLSPWVLCLPLIAAVQLVFTLALGTMFAAINTFFRDVQNVMSHALRLWFYLSGALIPLDTLASTHPTLYSILSLNPFAVLFNAYRSVTYGMGPPNWLALLLLLGISVVLLVVAIYGFKRAEPAFARIL